MIPIAPPMCYSPGMAYSRSPPAYYGSPLCALSPPSMQALAIAMTNSPSQSFSPACMYECSSPPVRPDGHVNMSATYAAWRRLPWQLPARVRTLLRRRLLWRAGAHDAADDGRAGR